MKDRKCAYCRVYKPHDQYASDTMAQCMKCSERRREQRQAKKAWLTVIKEDGALTMFCSDCGLHRPINAFEGQFRTCNRCRGESCHDNPVSASVPYTHQNITCPYDIHGHTWMPPPVAADNPALPTLSQQSRAPAPVVMSIPERACQQAQPEPDDEFKLSAEELEAVSMVCSGSDPTQNVTAHGDVPASMTAAEAGSGSGSGLMRDRYTVAPELGAWGLAPVMLFTAIVLYNLLIHFGVEYWYDALFSWSWIDTSLQLANRDVLRKVLAGACLVGSLMCSCKLDSQADIQLEPDGVEQARFHDKSVKIFRKTCLCACSLAVIQNLWFLEWYIAVFRAVWMCIVLVTPPTQQGVALLAKIMCYVVMPCRAVLGAAGVVSGSTFCPTFRWAALGAPLGWAIVLHRPLTAHLANVLFLNAVILLCAQPAVCAASIVSGLSSVALKVKLIDGNYRRRRQESVQEPHSDEADSTHTQPGYHCGNGGYPEVAVLATSGMLCGPTATPADRNLLSYITLALQAFLPGSCSSGSGSVSVKHDPEASGCIYTTLITVAFALALALYQQLHIECLNQDLPMCISVNWSREHENTDAMLKTLAGASLVGSIVCWCKVVLGTQASRRPDSDPTLAFAPRFYLFILPLSSLPTLFMWAATGSWADRLFVLIIYVFWTVCMSMLREPTHILRMTRVMWYGLLPCRAALGTLAVLSMPTFVPLSISDPFFGACLYQTQTEHLADMLFIGAVVLYCAETTLPCVTFTIAAVLSSVYVRVRVYSTKIS